MTDATNSMEEIAKALAENIRLRREVDRLKHMRSGTYNFRHNDIRDISRGIQAVACGESRDGLRLLEAVMDDLHADWREFA